MSNIKRFITLLLIASSCLVFTACASGTENMTNSQLIKEAKKTNKFPIKGFCIPDTFGVPMEPDEIWHMTWNGAASTTEEAETLVERIAIDSGGFATSYWNTTYIGESEYYFQYRLEINATNYGGLSFSSLWRVVVYNASIFQPSFKENVGYEFNFVDLYATTVLDILDIYTFFHHVHMSGDRIIERKLTETETEYIYTYYTVGIIYGDWGYGCFTKRCTYC